MRTFEEKATVVEKFEVVAKYLEEVGETELANFIKDRQTKAIRKSGSSKPKGATAEQIELRNTIVEVLTNAGVPLSISEMMKADERLATLSTSKISGNITPMLVNGKNPNPNGSLMRIQDKKTAKFTLA